MSTDAVALWPTFSRPQERARRLEKEAPRSGVEQVTQAPDRPGALLKPEAMTKALRPPWRPSV